MKKIALCVLFFTITGCSSLRDVQTRSGALWYDRAMQQGSFFMVKKERSEEIWGRAKNYIDNFSDTKLQSFNDTLLKTYPSENGLFAYIIARENRFDSTAFFVSCSGNKHSEEFSRIAAYYINTGDPIPEEIVDPVNHHR